MQADYFFGGSASDLEVSYIVYDASYSFASPEPYPWYSFGRGREFFWFDVDSYSYFGDVILSGEGVTDGDGRFVLDLPADLLADVEEGSRQITVEATVFDVSGQTVTGQTAMTFHAGEVYAGIQPASYVNQAGEEVDFELVTLDWFGESVSGEMAAVVVYQRAWERQDDGGYELLETVAGQAGVVTDEFGEATVPILIEAGGSYRAEVSVTDDLGNTQKSDSYFWVSGDDAHWRPEPENRQLRLIPNQAEYVVGDMAEILVQIPFAQEGDLTPAWVTVERGTLLDQWLVLLNGSSDIVYVPINKEHAPNAYVTIAVVKPEDLSEEAAAPYADMRLGILELPVDRAPLLLQVDIQPRLPEDGFFGAGDTAVFDITLTDHSGAPVAGEVSLALVDKALLSLAPDNAVDIADLFYGPQLYRSQVGGSLIVSADGLVEFEVEETEAEVEEDIEALATLMLQQTTEASAPKIETMEEEEMMEADFAGEPMAARSGFADEAADGSAAASATVREDFRDTAYWEARVTTDNVGRATVEIPLPDNLTTWQLQAKALAVGTLVGQESAEVRVNQPLLLRPITPRFFTVGDVVQLGTVVNNNTGRDQEVVVSLEAQGIEFLVPEAVDQVVTVPAQGSVVVRWPMMVADRDVRLVDLTFRAGNEEVADATKPTFATGPNQTIVVYRYNAEDIVATSGVLTADEQRRVEAILLPEGVDTTAGDLSWRFNASLAATILDTLDALDYELYDRSCAHAVASRLLPNVSTARMLDLLVVDDARLSGELNQLIPADVTAIEGLQRGDGGWGWCRYPESNPWFSAYVLLALDKAAEAGYKVSPEVLDDAARYLEQQLEPTDRLNGGDWLANRQAFFLYVLSEAGQDQQPNIESLVAESRDQLDSYAKALLVQALAATDHGDDPLVAELLSDLSSEAEVSATGAHWEDDDWSNLSSDIRATAMVLSAFAATDVDQPFGSQGVNWLMNARGARIWRSSHDTVWVLLGLTDWLAATDELAADYSFEVALNGDNQLEGAFNADNLTEAIELVLPINELKTDDVNFVALNKEGDGRLYYNAYLDTFISAELVEPVDRGITGESYLL